MSAFAALIDALFADANISLEAVFTPVGGTLHPVRVIARRPDRIIEFGNARLASDSALFDLRASEVANPRCGDRLDVAGVSYIIFGEPLRDAEQLVWTVCLGPA